MQTNHILQIPTLDEIRLVIREELSLQNSINEVKATNDDLLTLNEAAEYLPCRLPRCAKEQGAVILKPTRNPKQGGYIFSGQRLLNISEIATTKQQFCQDIGSVRNPFINTLISTR